MVGHDHRDRKEGQPDLQRVVVHDLAQVERAEEEHPEHARRPEHLDQVGPDHRAGSEHPQRHQRVPGGALPEHEPGQQRQRGRAQAERFSGQPALLGGRADDRVHAEHHGPGDQPGPGHVGACPQARTLVRLDHPAGRDGGEDADGQVDEEDPVPAQQLGDDATGQQPHGGAR
jgi:hypothetical protein